MELLITLIGYLVAIVLAGSLVCWVADGLTRWPQWAQIAIVAGLFLLLVVWPVVGVICGATTTDRYQPYDDRPYSGSDRYL